MKRLFALMIVLMIAMTTVTALAAEGDATLGRAADGSVETYYSGAFTVGDTLYLVNADGLSTWHVGDAQAVRYALQYPSKDGEADVSWSCWPFAANDSVYALAFATRYGENDEFLRAVLCKVSLTNEDGVNVAKLTEKKAVNWEGMIDRYELASTAREPMSCVGVGNLCCMMVCGSTDFQIRLLNVETGEMTATEGLADVCAVVPYRDGKLLVEQFSYDAPDIVCFCAYDPKDGTSQSLAQIPTENRAAFVGLAYDAATDAAYCVAGGEIHRLDLQNGTLGPAIADAPLESVSDNGACILRGGYYCYAASGAFVRNLDPDRRAETRIRVYDGTYNDSLYPVALALSEAHDGVAAAIDRDYNVGQKLDEDMAKRDAGIDVYVMNFADPGFDAVYRRGDMAGLDGSPKLTALAERMYANVRAALSVNGRFAAVPVTCDASTLAVNEQALARLGLKLDDVPANWSDMLDFIKWLPERIKPEDHVNLFYANQTFEEAKQALLSQLLQDYQNYADHTDPAPGYDTPLLRELLKKLDDIDFTRFGCKRESGDDGTARLPEGDAVETEDDSMALFETFSACGFGVNGSDFTPVLMAMDGDTPACLALNMSVAFINPNSKHPAEAMLFVEQLADAMRKEVLYSVDPTQNTPVRNRHYEASLKEMNDSLEGLRHQAAGADPAQRQTLEAQIREQEQALAALEQNSWEASRESIDWYRANDGNIVLQRYNRMNSGEVLSLIEQYVAGQINADAMLEGIDAADGEANQE